MPLDHRIVYDSSILKVGIAKPASNFAQLIPYLHPSELIRLKSKPLTSRIQSASCQILARKLAQCNLPIIHEESGRPTLEGVSVSLSHKEDLIAAAVTPTGFGIGVDVERIDSIKDPHIFMRHLLADGETIEPIMRSWNVSWKLAVVGLWSLKESYFKAVSTDLIPQSVRALGGRRIERWENGRWYQVEAADMFVEFRDEHVLTALALGASRVHSTAS